MEWLKNFFIPLIQVVFIFGIAGSFIFLLVRAGIKVWTKEWKWVLKYDILRKKIEEDIKPFLESKMNKDELYKFLLIEGVEMDKINEIMFIYNNLNKGGKK